MFALFVKKLDMELVMLKEVCVVSLSLGENLISRFIFKGVLVKVTRKRFPDDLMVLEMMDYSMTPGMGWLSKYNATISL